MLGVWSVPRSIFHKLLQATLLAGPNVLLVVLNSTYLLQFVPLLLSEFKFVQGLPKQAFLGNLERLTRVISEPRLALHHVLRCCCGDVPPLVNTVSV